MGPTDLGYAKTDASGRWPLLMALHPVRSACQRRWFALSIGCQVAQFSCRLWLSFRCRLTPFLVDKVRDILGQYLNPPDKGDGALR
jgi:hypothetical protein